MQELKLKYQKISSEEAAQLYRGLHYYPVEKKTPYMASRWSTRSWEETQTTHKHFDAVPRLNIGFRAGDQPDGRFVIALDCDVFFRADGSIHKSPEVEQHWTSIRQMTGDRGCFHSSSCGNGGCLVDVTDHPALVEQLRSYGKTTVHIDTHLEVFIGGNVVLPPSATECKRHRKICQPRKPLTETVVVQASAELVAWLTDRLPEIGAVKRKGKKTTAKQKKVQGVSYDDKPQYLSNDQYKLIKQLLQDLLPFGVADDRVKWRNVGWALRDKSNSETMFNLFHAWSKTSEKYEDGCCEKVWNSVSRGVHISFATLIEYHQNSGAPARPYGQLYTDQPIDLMAGVENLSLEIVEFDQLFITSKDGEIEIFDASSVEKLQGRFICVKSHTGSGKTVAMSTLVQRFRDADPDAVIVSVGSRCTLDEYHSKKFGLEFYQDADLHQWDTLQSVAIQLDSLVRLTTDLPDGKRLVLMLDELNSLIGHQRNEMAHMQRNRGLVLAKLNTLINRADVVFGVDADLSEPVLKYLSDLSQKKLSLYWNRHRLTQTAKVTVHSIKSRFIERVHAAIETGDPVFVGSDHHNEFRREVVDPLMKLMTKEQRERTHLFTAKDGDHNYLRDPSKLRHAIVFSSPTIVYGIDMNWKGHVFGYYLGGSIDALNSTQQIARIRQPLSIDLYFGRNATQMPQFFSPEDYRSFYEDSRTPFLKSLEELNVARLSGRQIDAYRELTYSLGYIQHRMTCGLRFHVLDILKKKGFKIQYDELEMEATLQVATASRTEYREQRTDEVRRLLEMSAAYAENEMLLVREDADLEDLRRVIEMQQETDRRVRETTDVAQIQRLLDGEATREEQARLDALGIQMNKLRSFMNDRFRRQSVDQLMGGEFVRELLADERRADCFIRFVQFRLTSVKDLEDVMKTKREVGSFHASRSTEYKMIQLKRLMKRLKVEDPFTVDFKELMKTPPVKTSWEVPVEMKTAFQLRGKKWSDKLDGRQQVALMADCCYSLFGDVMTTSKIKLEGKQHRLKVFHGELLGRYLEYAHDGAEYEFTD